MIFNISYSWMVYYLYYLLFLILILDYRFPFYIFSKMVKNTKGGKGAKSMARKSVSGGAASGFPVPTSQFEQIAVVTQMFGPSCRVLLLDGTSLLCHIRNKFKGRRKSGNLVILGSILLVGLRDWEPDTARKNCDLLFVYDNVQAASLADRFDIPELPCGGYTPDVSDIAFQTDAPDIHFDATLPLHAGVSSSDQSFLDL